MLYHTMGISCCSKLRAHVEGGGGVKETIAHCAPVKFLSGREEARDIFMVVMMGWTDCIYLLSHCG